MAGQRLRDLNLDFSGFSRAAGRTVDAARIEAEGTAALGAGIARGVDAVSSGIVRRRGEQRADALRAEESARLDAREAKADARYNEERAYRAEQDQYRRDAQNREIIDARLKALGAEADDAVTLGDANRATEILSEINKYNALKQGIEGRLMGGQRGMDASMQSLADRDPEAADAAMDRLGYDSRPAGRVAFAATRQPTEVPGYPMPAAPPPPGPRAKAGPSGMDNAATAAVDGAFAGGPGFFPKRPTIAGYETSPVPAAPTDPIADGLARAAALREQQKQLNARAADAAKRGDRVTAGKFFDRATLAAADAAREEASVKTATARAEEDKKAREAAATLAQKKAEAEEKQREADRKATAEFAAESGQPWLGPVLDEGTAKGRLAAYRNERERTEKEKAKADERAREDAIRADERRRADDKTVAGEVRRAGEDARDVTEKEITDAEQDYAAKQRVYLALAAYDPGHQQQATKDAKAAMADAEKRKDDARKRRRGGSPAPADAPPAAASPAPTSRIREWATGR